jgi:dTDP-4-amino-4,6-dideoxygalactose transaminase
MQLRKAGFGVQVNYLPAHLHPVFQRKGFDWGGFPNSETYYQQEISLPMWPGILDLGSEYFESISNLISRYN